MSFDITIPSSAGGVTAEDFDQTAEQVLTDYLSTWSDGEQKTATKAMVDQALEIVAAAVDPPGIVGDTFRVTISGHAPDSCTIGFLRVVPEASSATAAPSEPGG